MKTQNILETPTVTDKLRESPDAVLQEIFEAQADARPEAIAIVFGPESVTYAELESRANRFARHLRGRGVGPGAVVGLLLPRSIDIYVALLGILKSGAAYVPMDPEYPEDRIAYILENSEADLLVTTSELAKRHETLGGKVVFIDLDKDLIAAESSARLPRAETGVGSEDLCYIIYTSGSTGRPKGVMVEHRNAWHLVQAEGFIYAVDSRDRVFQGASLCFDLSVEEIWLAFKAGATMVAATPEMAHAGPDLSRMLADSGVTVLSCVPTLLSMLKDDVPALRLLILGGETCPDRLVERWLRPGRRIVNTYGPTETTVIATYADVRAGHAVTIGKPAPGYRVYLLDAELQAVPRGEVGEICIGGPGVARGYVKRPDENRERFVPDPFVKCAGVRIYRSGDLGRMDSAGNIQFVGRGDSQVKLRGFRIELAEIESVMLEAPNVRAAACGVHEDHAGVQQLIGYVVSREGDAVQSEDLRKLLRDRLPSFMVPAIVETVDALPRLPNGKLDRASLPAPKARDAAPRSMDTRPRTQTERRIAQVWETLFHPQPVSVDDHFFLDLGGHSLLVARLVSELRKHRQFAKLSVTDVYDYPTVASLAAAIEKASHQARTSEPVETPTPPGRKKDGPRDKAQHFCTGLLQAASLYFVLGLRALHWVTPYLVYFLLLEGGRSILESAAWAAASAVAVLPATMVIAVAAKWLLLGRIKPGRHPLWSLYYLRWWFTHMLIDAVPAKQFSGTPLLPFYYRLLGARIGKDVYIGTDRLAAFDLISIGDGSSVDEEAALFGDVIEGGELVIGPVRVGRECFVGTRAALREYTVMEDGARLEDLSLLSRGGVIPAGETWAGSPARRVAASEMTSAPRPVRSPLQLAGVTALYAALTFLFFPIINILGFVPGIALLSRLDVTRPSFFLVAPLVGASFVLILTVQVVLLKRLIVGRVRAGTYPVHGEFYVRNWIVDRLLAFSLDVVGPLHATLYLAPWYRALGAKLGRFVELSTAFSTTPDLLEIEDGGTVADEVSLGAARVEKGWMTVAPTRIGRRAFVGNSAVIPAGTTLGDGSLVGVLSIPPSDQSACSQSGASWMGSPPILLPRREPSAVYPDSRTYSPSRKLWLTRAAIEIFRVTLPPAGFIVVTASMIHIALELWSRFSLTTVLFLLPAAYGACCAAVLGVILLLKWILLGRFRPFAHPLWSTFVWRLEFVNALYEFLATPLALEALQGTPMLPWYLRLLGARIGRRVYIRTTGFLEFDLIEIGDRAALNDDCVMQTHLFEDRVLKGAVVRIGADCEVGADSVVLYESEMEEGSRLGAISLLMKGERLPAGTVWAGSPAAWQHQGAAEAPALPDTRWKAAAD